jgi:TonB family protein
LKNISLIINFFYSFGKYLSIAMRHIFKVLNKHKKSIFYTLLVYAILLGALISLGIKAPPRQVEIDGFEVDFEDDNEMELPQIDEKLNEDFIDDKRLNIAVNDALKDDPVSNPYDFYDMPEQSDEYKNELIKKALSPDEYDKYFNKDDNYLHDEIDEQLPKNEKQTKKTDNDKKSNYQGATYIHFNLKNRYEQKLIIPTYKCEGYGKVVVKIVVNRNGKVVKAEIISSNNNNECLNSTALEAAKNSTFNKNINAPERQTGTISYTFMAQ